MVMRSKADKSHRTAAMAIGWRRSAPPRTRGTFPVIHGLDHVVLLVNDIGAGARAYQTLFGLRTAWQSAGDGADACCSQ